MAEETPAGAAAELTVWSANPEADAPLLEALGGTLSRTRPNAPPADGGLLLLCPAPQAALVYALTQGAEPEAALEGWRAEAERLLRLHRAARERVMLAERQAARADPAASTSASTSD